MSDQRTDPFNGRLNFLNFLRKWMERGIRGRLVRHFHKDVIMANIVWLFLDTVVRMAVGLMVTVWAARYLGPVQFGILNYAAALVALFSPLTTLGLEKIVVRDLVREPEGSDVTLGTAFWLMVSGSLLSICAIITLVLQIRTGDSLTILVVGILSLGTLFNAFQTIDFWFQSKVRSKYMVYARNAAFFISSGIKVAMILAKAPLEFFAAVIVFEATMGAVFAVVAYRFYGRSITKFKFSLGRARKLVNESWPLIFSGFAIMVYIKVDLVMLGEMVGSQMVGLYSAAVKISEIWYFIPSAIVASVFPSVVKAKEESEGEYYAKMGRLFSLMAVLALAIALPMTFLSDRLVNILYGRSYASAGAMLSVHIWAGVFVFMGVAREYWIVNEGFIRFSLISATIGMIMNVVLNLILIPRYGGLGSAMATVISYGISSHITGFLTPKTRYVGTLIIKATIFPWRYLLKSRT